MKPKKSAKDMAFDKERANYRKKIRELERDVAEFQLAIMQKDNEIRILQNELEQKSDWIRRLLEYTELSEEDMREMINKEKNVSAVMKMFSDFGNAFSSVYRMRGES